MDLRHLRHFVAVAEEMHFGRAAKRLNMAQPPLSQSIRRLELSLGVDLLDRSRRVVALSSAGQVFLDQARQTLLQAELARKMAQREAAKPPEVRVSFVGPALYRVLPELLASYRAAAPGVLVRLFEDTSPNQMTGLDVGEFDVGFLSGIVPRSGDYATLLVERAKFLAAVPADGPFAGRSTITLAELAEQPFIMPPKRYLASSSGVMGMFKHVGVVANVTQEAIQTETTISLVGAGIGCSVVVSTAALLQRRNVLFLPIADDVPQNPWELVMAWRPELMSQLARDFVRFAERFISDNPHFLDVDLSPR